MQTKGQKSIELHGASTHTPLKKSESSTLCKSIFVCSAHLECPQQMSSHLCWIEYSFYIMKSLTKDTGICKGEQEL